MFKYIEILISIKRERWIAVLCKITTSNRGSNRSQLANVNTYTRVLANLKNLVLRIVERKNTKCFIFTLNLLFRETI